MVPLKILSVMLIAFGPDKRIKLIADTTWPVEIATMVSFLMGENYKERA
jgi:hypothetical protein